MSLTHNAARGDVMDRAELTAGKDLSYLLRGTQREALIAVSHVLDCPLDRSDVRGSADLPTVDGMDGWEWLDAMTQE